MVSESKSIEAVATFPIMLHRIRVARIWCMSCMQLPHHRAYNGATWMSKTMITSVSPTTKLLYVLGFVSFLHNANLVRYSKQLHCVRMSHICLISSPMSTSTSKYRPDVEFPLIGPHWAFDLEVDVSSKFGTDNEECMWGVEVAAGLIMHILAA